MAINKFIDADISAGARATVASVEGTGTDKHVRVAWDSAISRNGLIRALRDIAADLGDGGVYGEHFTENRTAADRTIADA